MKLRRAIAVPRLLAAVLLLVGMSEESKVVCISPSGHEAIEDWLALCCGPGIPAPGAAFSEPTPCQGCTDYPVVPTIEITCAQPDFSRAAAIANSALPAVTPDQQAAAAAMNCAPGLAVPLDSADSPPASPSLRC